MTDSIDRPDGWYTNPSTFQRELWAGGAVIYSVALEAWPDFVHYLQTERGDREGRERGWFAPGWSRPATAGWTPEGTEGS